MEFSVEKFSDISPNANLNDQLNLSVQNFFSSFLNFLTQISANKNNFSLHALQFLFTLIDLELKNFSNRFGSMVELNSVILSLVSRIPEASEQQLSCLLKIFIKYLMISLQVPLGNFLKWLILRFGFLLVFKNL